MSVQAVQPTAERARSPGSRDGDRARVLRLLEDDQTGALTIAALRERGVEAPALIVYELQLAGYEIERVHVRQPDGHVSLGYRLRAAAAPEPRDGGR